MKAGEVVSADVAQGLSSPQGTKRGRSDLGAFMDKFLESKKEAAAALCARENAQREHEREKALKKREHELQLAQMKLDTKCIKLQTVQEKHKRN